MKPGFLETLSDVPDEKVAVIDDGEMLTYGQLRDRAGHLADGLHQRFGSGQYLLLPANSDAGFVTMLLAVMYSGNTPVPIDPALPEAGVEYISEKSRAAAILDNLDESEWTRKAIRNDCDGSMPALILFTSGTSGYPKGVIISHENLLHACRAISAYLEYPRYPSAAVALPLHYSYALLSQVCCMLSVGGRVRLFSSLRNPLEFANGVNELELETFCGVPSTYNALCAFHAMAPLKMPSVRVLCSAGAAMDRSKYETIKTIFPNAVFFNNYGMTEAAPRISFIRDDDPKFHEPTCGRAMEGVEVRIVDPETHNQLPDGVEGMLVVRGPNITAGYLNDPELTQAAYTRDGFLISGDIARKRGEYIFITGRHDDIFNMGGEKVAPLEIERVLNKHKAVEVSAVAGIPDAQRGKVAVAFVKLRHDASRKQLVDHLGEWLPKAKIPLRYLEVRDFPMTANGKLKRRNLSADDSKYVVREIT